MFLGQPPSSRPLPWKSLNTPEGYSYAARGARPDRSARLQLRRPPRVQPAGRFQLVHPIGRPRCVDQPTHPAPVVMDPGIHSDASQTDWTCGVSI